MPPPDSHSPPAAAESSELEHERSLQLMFDCFKRGDEVYLPSKYWSMLNDRNVEQIGSHGLDNFKRTLARNYFTFVPRITDAQFRFLLRRTPWRAWPSILRDFPPFDPAWRIKRKKYWEFIAFTRLLWRYAQAHDPLGLLRTIHEPLAGNPLPIQLDGQLVSQDLANSVLEYYSVAEGAGLTSDSKLTICELGAGYGRNAYVFLKALPKCRYLIVDIPPALYVAQQYLTPLFPERKVFKFRPFADDPAALAELEQSEIAFLLPHQAARLRPKSVNFTLIDTLTCGHFYSKQWIVSKNRADGLQIRQGDYPIPPHWSCRFTRRAAVQTAFFEACYLIPEK
jgi:putative sugar O-methyltransferase